jgi:hypothetical protein
MTAIALSVRRPWAQLIIAGRKPVENRTWPASYRGRIWVHAGHVWDPTGATLAARIGLTQFTHPDRCPAGYLGTVDLAGMHPAQPSACCAPVGTARTQDLALAASRPAPATRASLRTGQARPVPAAARAGRPATHRTHRQPRPGQAGSVPRLRHTVDRRPDDRRTGRPVGTSHLRGQLPRPLT